MPCGGRDQRVPGCRYVNKEAIVGVDPPAPAASAKTAWIRDKWLSQALPKFLTYKIMSKITLLL